ncbi:hypothetical protein GV51_1172 [Gardnerella vaginalis 5-1]|nr:hypothetical protein GV51_1172 [Gardnerella vaginalis 5-1]
MQILSTQIGVPIFNDSAFRKLFKKTFTISSLYVPNNQHLKIFTFWNHS